MEPVKGILCATVTPLRADETVDTEAVGRICHHVVDGGVDGFLVLGSTGEGLALDREAKKSHHSHNARKHSLPICRLLRAAERPPPKWRLTTYTTRRNAARMR